MTIEEYPAALDHQNTRGSATSSYRMQESMQIDDQIQMPKIVSRIVTKAG
jgi:hypothetical protein